MSSMLGVEVDSINFTVENVYTIAKHSLRLEDEFIIWYGMFRKHSSNSYSFVNSYQLLLFN